MSGAHGNAGITTLRGACLGARALAILAAVEALAAVLAPSSGPVASVVPDMGMGGLARMGAAWVAIGALAGGVVGALAGGLSRGRADTASTGERLAVATGAFPIVAVGAHAIAVTPPVSRLVLLLAGCAIALVLVGARAVREAGAVLRALASPWTLAVWGVALSVGLLELERHAGAGRQATTMLGLGVGIFGAASLFGVVGARVLGGSPGPGARAGGSLAVALLAWGLAVGIAGAAERSRGPELPPPRAADTAGRTSVVLITLDTVRSDHLSLYGYERDTTPHLKEFARRARVFNRAVAASDLTLSTHASLFTGLYASQHGARIVAGQGASTLADGFLTLAEVLGDAGYLSVGVVANPSYLASRYGVAQGFDWYDDRHPVPRIPELPSHFPGRSIARGLAALGVGGERFVRADDTYRVAEVMNREVFEVLELLAERPDPFFLFVNYMDAHWPYDPPPPFDTRFPGRLGPGSDPPGTETFRAARRLERAPSEAERLHMVSRYDGEIAYLDHELGRLFDRLEELGLLDRSLIVITADHGEAFGEHGLYAHGVSVYQDQVHVPLVIRRPGQERGETSDVWASSVDLLPTVLAGAGLPVPERLSGRSLAGSSLLGDGPPTDRVVMSESYPDSALRAASPRFRRTLRAVFQGDRKLIASSQGRRQLYDLRRDPSERNDLHEAPGDAPRLEAALAHWHSEGAAPTGAAPSLDDATRRRLHALGYAR